MQFSLHFLAGGFLLATLVGALPAPVPIAADALVERADVSTEEDSATPAPEENDPLAAYAKAHNVAPPSVGVDFEGGADY
ncbi:hypothetical protein GGR51DRAFT_555622 [Nemania sp. FL0031]|nr:hypothetical protein GGR51DRAFT_555622 [Nemania sp. FL0031]